MHARKRVVYVILNCMGISLHVAHVLLASAPDVGAPPRHDAASHGLPTAFGITYFTVTLSCAGSYLLWP
jgi:hypothetical protein